VGLSVSCAVLGALGGAEFVAGHVGAGIWLAVAVELPLAACFWAVRNADAPFLHPPASSSSLRPRLPARRHNGIGQP
jgi:hypothetical protein